MDISPSKCDVINGVNDFSIYCRKPHVTIVSRGRSGSVVEYLTRDRIAAGSSLTGVIALCPLARHIKSNLVLVQPRETRPDVTEGLLTGM